MGRVGLDELIGQPQSLAEIEAPRNGRDEIIGALLDLEAVFVDGRQHTAEPRARLQQPNLAGRVQLDQSMGGRQSGNSTADDGDASGGLLSVVQGGRSPSGGNGGGSPILYYIVGNGRAQVESLAGGTTNAVKCVVWQGEIFCLLLRPGKGSWSSPTPTATLWACHRIAAAANLTLFKPSKAQRRLDLKDLLPHHSSRITLIVCAAGRAIISDRHNATIISSALVEIPVRDRRYMLGGLVPRPKTFIRRT